MDPHFQLLLAGAKIWNDVWGRCLEPNWKCGETPIRAHSIQNARFIDKIARDDHVFVLNAQPHPKRPPLPDFQRVSRNKASTFEGFCGSHDHKIFARIDTESISVDDPEQLFLLAYRAITRELHSNMAGAFKAQRAYKKAVELGLSPGDRPCDLGIFAVGWMAAAHDIFCYRAPLDVDLLEGRFDRVHHRIIPITCTGPTLAVSSLFSPLEPPENRLYLTLSVLPLEDTLSAAIFSWIDQRGGQASAWLDQQFPDALGNEATRMRLSRITLANCENAVFSQELVEGMPEQTKSRVRAFYLKTVFGNDDGSDIVDVDLFR